MPDDYTAVYAFVGWIASILSYGQCLDTSLHTCSKRSFDIRWNFSYIFDVGIPSGVASVEIRNYLLSQQVMHKLS